MKEYDDIINLIKGIPAVSIPDDFTESVMKRLPYRKYQPKSTSQALLNKIHMIFSPRAAIKDSFTPHECSFYFFLAGAFHLILAVTLFVGFKKLCSTFPGALWIISQPAISLLTAFAFTTLGTLLYKKSIHAVKTVQIGIAGYIILLIINGLTMHHHFNIPLIMVVVLSFTVGGILLGVTLTFIVHRCEISSAHSEYPEPATK